MVVMAVDARQGEGRGREVITVLQPGEEVGGVRQKNHDWSLGLK